MKILLTGASGMIGSRFVELLSTKHQIIQLSTSLGIDLTDNNSLSSFVAENSPEVIVHLAAKANVDECEKDRESDLQKINSEVNRDFDVIRYCQNESTNWVGANSSFGVNVIGTFNIANAASKIHVPFIYISTDFVFDGTKDNYSEEDEPNPVDWYGMTKYLGEKVSTNVYSDTLITRISYPYGISPSPKKDFVRKMADFLKEKGALTLISDQMVTPTYIDDVVNGIDFLVLNNVSSEKLHLVGASSLSPYDIGVKLTEKLGIKAELSKVSGNDFFKDRAQRPFILKMKNDKLNRLGFQTLTFDEGLERLIPIL